MSKKKIGDVILDVQNISLRFGGVKALTDISFNVKEHEIRAIIGPNGAGKSSMLNCINGVYQPQEGKITFRGKTEQYIETQVKFEDGRTGSVSATLKLADAKTFAPVKAAA